MAEEVVIRIKGDSADAQAALDKVSKSLAGVGNTSTSTNQKSQSLFSNLKAGWFVAAAAVAGAVVVMKDFVNEAMESQRVEAQLNSVLKSTGQIAGVTAENAISLAKSLQEITTYTDDAILSTENLLLTFTNIGKDIFPQATQTVLDMSTALGQDTKNSAIQLGKALQDPIAGVTALRRVGVMLTKQQEDQIKVLVESGKTMEAQKIILKELSTEFGGSAAAAAGTFEGKMLQLKNSLGEIKETIGFFIIGQIDKIATGFNKLAKSAEVIKGIEIALKGIGVVLTLLKTELMIVKNFFDVMLAPILESIKAIVKNFDELMSAKTFEDRWNAIKKIGTQTWTGIKDSAKENLTDTKKIVIESIDSMGNDLKSIGGIIKNGVTKPIIEIAPKAKESFEDLVNNAEVKFGEFKDSFSVQFVNSIRDILDKWKQFTKGNLAETFKDLLSSVGDIFNQIGRIVGGGIGKAIKEVGGLVSALSKGPVAAFVYILGKVADLVEKTRNATKRAAEFAREMVQMTNDIYNEIITNQKDANSAAKSAELELYGLKKSNIEKQRDDELKLLETKKDTYATVADYEAAQNVIRNKYAADITKSEKDMARLQRDIKVIEATATLYDYQAKSKSAQTAELRSLYGSAAGSYTELIGLLKAQTFAQGGSFTVPSGYRGDTYPVMASSGERVTVTPADRNGGSTGAGIVINNMTIVSNNPQQFADQLYQFAGSVGSKLFRR